MGKIEAHFEVDDDIDPARTDPMSLIELVLDAEQREVDLLSAEWVE